MKNIYVGNTPLIDLLGGGNSFDINNYLKNPKKISELDFSKEYSNPLSGKLLFADISYKGYRYFGYIQKYEIPGYSYGNASSIVSICPITLVYWNTNGKCTPQSIVYWNCNHDANADAFDEVDTSGWTDYIFNNIYAGYKPD